MFVTDPVVGADPFGGIGKGLAKLVGRTENAAHRERRDWRKFDRRTSSESNRLDRTSHRVLRFGRSEATRRLGEARLTTHRQEVEENLKDRLKIVRAHSAGRTSTEATSPICRSRFALGFRADGRAVPQANVGGTGFGPKGRPRRDV